MGTEVVQSPCTGTEKWPEAYLAQILPPETRTEFVRFLSGERQPFAAFAEISALAEGAPPKGRTLELINYWLGRTLYAFGLYSEAGTYFDQLMALAPDQDRLPIQMAAMACLQKVHEQAPQVELSKKAIANIPAFYEPWLVPKAQLPILWDATVFYALSLIRDGKTKALDSTMIMLEGSGAHEEFVEGLWAIEKKDMDVAAASLAKLLSEPQLPASLARRRNELRLLLGTALYGLEDYKGAIKQLELVDKKSNELVQAQALLASAQLMLDDASKSLASAAVLKSKAFRATFVPSAFTTLSMGLIEFCRYPEAQSNLNDFRREYEPSYRWLKRQVANGEGSAPQLYPLAIAYLQGKETSVPRRVASEWVRSPIFISHQAAINSLFQGTRNVDHLAEGVNAARLVAIEELKHAERALADAKGGEDKKADGREVSSFRFASFEAALAHAKARMERLQKAEPKWAEFLAQHQENTSREKEKLGAAIETHLKRVTARMLAELERVIENNEAVEAELLNSATQDMVVSSADPESVAPRKPASTSRTEDLEVWEDELGVSDVNIQNHCLPQGRRSGKGAP